MKELSFIVVVMLRAQFFWLAFIFCLGSPIVSASTVLHQNSDSNSDGNSVDYPAYQLAASNVVRRYRPSQTAASNKVVVRNQKTTRKKRKSVTRKVPRFSYIPVAELKRNAEKCTLTPNSWAFVRSTKNTLSDYQRALSQLSGDDVDLVTKRLQEANPNNRLNALKFFSYIRIPTHYKPIFQKKYQKQINNNNKTKDCKAAARPARVFVAPSNMAIQALIYVLGSRQKESFSILANQMAQLNTNVRPGAIIKKGDMVLIPQSYPYSSAVVASASSKTTNKKSGSTQNTTKQVVINKKPIETSSEGQRTDSRGGFVWSFGYGQLSSTFDGEDTIGGGSFQLISGVGSAWEATLGYDFDSTKGQLIFSLGYNKTSIQYSKPTNVTLLETDISTSYPVLHGYYQQPLSKLGVAVDIGQKYLAGIKRSSSSQAEIVGEDVVYVAGALHYKPPITLLNVSFDVFVRVNTPLSAGDIEGAFAIDAGALALVHVTKDYDISLDMGLRNSEYKEVEKNFTNSGVYIGVSIYGI